MSLDVESLRSLVLRIFTRRKRQNSLRIAARKANFSYNEALVLRGFTVLCFSKNTLLGQNVLHKHLFSDKKPRCVADQGQRLSFVTKKRQKHFSRTMSSAQRFKQWRASTHLRTKLKKQLVY